MAYQVIDPIKLPPKSAVAATYDITIADYGLSLVDDDYLLVSIVCGATSGTLSASAGWSELSEISVTNGPRMAHYLAKVASGTVADLTVTLSTGTGVWIACMEQWRDVDTTTGTITTDFAETPVTSQTTTTDASTLASGSSTPSANDCTIHYFGGTRSGAAINPCRFLSDKVVGQAMQNTDDNNTFISYGIGTVQQQTAANTQQTMYNAIASRCGLIVLNIKNKSGGKVEPDCRAAMTKVGWFGDFGITHESGAALAASLGAPSTFCVWNGGTEQINGIDVHTSAGTMTNDTAGLAPVSGRYSQIASTLSTANMWVGGWWATPSAIDMTGKIFSIEWHLTLAGFQIGPEGVLIAFGDNATADTGNAAVFQLAPKGKINAPEAYTSHIAVETADQYTTIGSINWATVNKIGIFYHRAGSSTTSRQVVFRNMFLHGTSAMVGGSSAKPLDIRFLDKALNGWGYAGLCTKTGDAVLVKSSVQFGDGTIPTYVDTTATLLNTPAAYSPSTQHLWNVPANNVTIGVKAASGDTMRFVASAMAAGAGAEQNFTIDPATSSGATVSFQGEVISNFLFAGDTDAPISGATYSGCDEVAFGGAIVTNTTVTDTTSADAAVSWSSNPADDISGCTFDGTGALYAIELGASVTAISFPNCTITAGSTDKVHVKATTGTVTITISGTTSLAAGDVTTDGATVDIAAPQLYQSVVVSGFTAGSRIQIYDTTNAEELFNGTATAGDTVVSGTTATWTDPLAASGTRAIRVRVAYVNGTSAKAFVESTGLTCGITEGTESITYPISQVDDTVYNANAENGSTIYGGGEITFVDASPDRVDMNMAAATLSLQKQYAAWAYYAFTATGIATDIDYINAIDTANYEFTNIRWKNTATAPATLTITGGYAWDSSTGLAITLVDTSGGTIFLMPDHVVAYATGSGVTAQDITDIAAEVLTQAASTPIYADIRKVNSYTVDGFGSDADPWGPV